MNYIYKNKWLLSISVLGVILQLGTLLNSEYGYFIDEFYYIACATFPSAGYVDHPPLAPIILTVIINTIGTSLFAIRFLPALLFGAVIFITGKTTEQLGGNTFAVFVSALAVFISPVVLIMYSFYTVNAFELFFWVSYLSVFALLLKTQESKYIIAMAVLASLGFLSKHTMAAVVGLSVLALLLSPQRKLLFTKNTLIAVAIAIAIISPNIIWQIQNNFISLEFYKGQSGKNIPTPYIEGVINQLLFTHPLNALFWISGLVFTLSKEHRKTYASLGFTFIGLFVFIILSQVSRPDRIAGVYPIMFSAGAVLIEKFVTNRIFLKKLIPTIMVLAGIVFLPISIPLLPAPVAASYVATLGINPQIELGKTSPLPQWLADRFGWEETIKAVASAYHNLTPEEKRLCVLSAGDYGHAGALMLWKEKYDLPPVISTHNNFWIWGKGVATPQILLSINSKKEDLEYYFEEVTIVGEIEPSPYAISWRQKQTVFISRIPKVDLREQWDSMRGFN